eukprot:TRINITY_DN74771_c0_g1_i1.p1 TRINITY_DN74771_c0_g1~~TRINITY_DN74771_c0_g1_i1.p1  ORF type:complete len:744 (-),score=106.35 TRINITY_DN74771_c0_g1_i1:392-2623(-)
MTDLYRTASTDKALYPISENPEDWRITKTTKLTSGDPEKVRAEIRDYFHKTYSLHELLYNVLKDKDTHMPVKAINLRHPLIFYYNHTAAFYLNKLYLGKWAKERIDPQLEFMVAVGVDEMSWDDCNEAHYDWPSFERSEQFRRQVRKVVDDIIVNEPLTVPVTWDSPFWAVLMGIEHERIHIETSSVLLRQHKIERVQPHPYFKICPDVNTPAPKNELVACKGGEIKLGKEHWSPDTYGWDNEYGTNVVNVKDFKCSKYLVSNEEFFEFMQDKGYETQKWWTPQGWKWVTQMKITHPEFWVPDSSKERGYRYRTLSEEIDMPWSWPVNTNYLEGKAFANWKAEKTGKCIRLPTEAEWYTLVRNAGLKDQPDWEKAPGNINMEYYSSGCPVDKFPQGDLYDIVGNGWQWTETHFDSHDETFRFHPLYHDFSSPTFDTCHNIIKGGTWCTTGNEAIHSSRYAFRRHFFQHAGFRYVETSEPDEPYQTANKLVNQTNGNRWEMEKTAMQHMEFHYGREYLGVSNFPKKCADVCIEMAKELKLTKKALEVGCAAGRTTFELTRQFESVVGVDSSSRMVWSAMDMQQLERVLWTIATEAELCEGRQATLESLGLSEDCFVRLAFRKNDCMNLDSDLTGYELIFAGNVLEHLSKPRTFLSTIKDRLVTGGLLILTSTYQWDEQDTPKEEWLGGYVDQITNVYTYPQLKKELEEQGFKEYKKPRDLEYIYMLSQRKFIHGVAELSVWQKA